MSVMKRNDKRTWTTALRSGLFKQTQSRLRRAIGYVKNKFGVSTNTEVYAYCCLGVAQCVLAGKQPKLKASMLRGGRFGLSRNLQAALACSNDGANLEDRRAAFELAGFETIPASGKRGKSSFKQIADWVDANL